MQSEEPSTGSGPEFIQGFRVRSKEMLFGTPYSALRTLYMLLSLVLVLIQPLWSAESTPQSTLPTPQSEALPPIVTRIEVQGARHTSVEQILKLIKSRVGQPFSEEMASSDLSRIFEMGHFSNVTVKRQAEEGGLALIYVVEEKPILAHVVFEGNKAFDRSRLLKEAGLAEGDFVEFFDLAIGADRLRAFYHKEGFELFELDKDVKETPEGLEVTYRLREGPKVRIEKVEFLGNVSFPDSILYRLVGTRPRRLILGGGVLDRDQLQLDLLRLRRFYYDRGWLDVEVTSTSDYSKDGTRLVVTFVIEEGRRYRVDFIEVAGNQAIEGRRIRERLRMAPGDYFEAEKLARDVRSVLDLYGEGGFVETAVDPRTSFDVEKALVSLEYSLQEGQRFTVDRVIVRGNYKSKDKVLRREISLVPGEVLKGPELRESRRRLLETRYFSEVNVSLEPGSFPDSKNVYVDVTEQTTGALLFGVGVSTNAGLVGTISLTQRNFDIADFPTSLKDFLEGGAFIGAGQVLELSAQPGTQLSRFRIRFYEPYFLDQPVGLDLQAYIWQRKFESYDESRFGGTVTVARRFGRRMALSLGVRLEDVEIDSVNADAPPDVFAVEGSNDVRTVVFSASYDKRDSIWFPTQGYLLRATFENAGTLLGGDFDFNRLVLTGTCYKTVHVDDRERPHILALRAEGGIVDETGGSDFVPIFERFFLGGQTTLRGFDFRGVGPRVLDEPVGGEVLLLANAEYSFPVYENFLRGVTFVDVGSVYGEPGDVSRAELRSAAGVGARIYPPGWPIPITLDWGFVLSSEPGDREQVFSFSVGTIF